MYFVVMTQTTVGYGAPYEFTPYEKLFVMAAQFVGIALFSTITAEVF